MLVKKIKAQPITKIKPKETIEAPFINDHHIPGVPWQIKQNIEKHIRKKQEKTIKIN